MRKQRFDFVPKVVLITLNYDTYHKYVGAIYFIQGQDKSNGIDYPFDFQLLLALKIQWNNTTVQWWVNASGKGDNEQLNIRGCTYFYSAVG